MRRDDTAGGKKQVEYLLATKTRKYETTKEVFFIGGWHRFSNRCGNATRGQAGLFGRRSFVAGSPCPHYAPVAPHKQPSRDSVPPVQEPVPPALCIPPRWTNSSA
jgi:hypothetical protein